MDRQGSSIDNSTSDDSPPSSWIVRAKDPGRSQAQGPVTRRVGWLVVGIAAAVLISFATYVAIGEMDTGPGEGEFAFFISPITAGGYALVLGVVLLIVAYLRLLDITPDEAIYAGVYGVVTSPIVYFVLLMVAAYTMDLDHSAVLDSLVTFALPAVLGTCLTILLALFRRHRDRRTAAPGSGPPSPSPRRSEGGRRRARRSRRSSS